MGALGPVVLVTVRCPALDVHAPVDGAPLFQPHEMAGFADRLGVALPLPGASRTAPLGAGAGASTATLVAISRAAGFSGPPEELAAACIAIEGASDPLMFPNPDRLLWASRSGRVIRRLEPPPRCDILGGLWGPPQRTDAKDTHYDDITDLIDGWVQATDRQELGHAAALATHSAQRCTALRGPSDPMPDLARDLGALGWIRAHTGSARGLIFAPGAQPPHGPAALREAGLTDILQFGTGGQ